MEGTGVGPLGDTLHAVHSVRHRRHAPFCRGALCVRNGRLTVGRRWDGDGGSIQEENKLATMNSDGNGAPFRRPCFIGWLCSWDILTFRLRCFINFCSLFFMSFFNLAFFPDFSPGNNEVCEKIQCKKILVINNTFFVCGLFLNRFLRILFYRDLVFQWPIWFPDLT